MEPTDKGLQDEEFEVIDPKEAPQPKVIVKDVRVIREEIQLEDDEDDDEEDADGFVDGDTGDLLAALPDDTEVHPFSLIPSCT